MSHSYDPDAPTRAEIDTLAGTTLLNFGTDWCGHCQAAQPIISAAIAEHPSLRHLQLEDGKGRPLGRSYGVKLWPTLVCLRDGEEVGRLVRPDSPVAVQELLALADITGHVVAVTDGGTSLLRTRRGQGTGDGG